MKENRRGNNGEMKFSPQSGEVVAHSAQDLMDANIHVPVNQVEQRWGMEEAEEYRSWQVEQRKAELPPRGDIFQP